MSLQLVYHGYGAAPNLESKVFFLLKRQNERKHNVATTLHLTVDQATRCLI